MKNNTIMKLIFLLILFSLFSISLFSQEKNLERKNPIPFTSESVEAGKDLFFRFCSGCHGERADGRGPQALNLVPKPQNLLNTFFVKYLSDERMFSSISGGVRGTSMPAFEMYVNETQRWHLINYVRSLIDNNMNLKNSPETAEKETGQKIMREATPDSVKNGEVIYKKMCQSCHGEEIDGLGKTSENLIPRPRNLVVITSWGEKPFLNYLEDHRLFDSIANGVAGTSMSPWFNVLTVSEIWDVIDFLRAEAKKEKKNFEQSYIE
ncbi:MAG: cytochrome c [Acidobacteriota bacterium]